MVTGYSPGEMVLSLYDEKDVCVVRALSDNQTMAFYGIKPYMRVQVRPLSSRQRGK